MGYILKRSTYRGGYKHSGIYEWVIHGGILFLEGKTKFGGREEGTSGVKHKGGTTGEVYIR